LILSFSFAGVIHLSVKLLKGKGDYSDTYKALIYSETPPYLFGWLPYVGLIFGLYGFYLFLKGISKLHEVSMGRAFVIAILPGAIVVIIAVAAVVTFWYFVPAPPPVPSIPITGRLLSVISKIPVS
jgi:hypothetical protein